MVGLGGMGMSVRGKWKLIQDLRRYRHPTPCTNVHKCMLDTQYLPFRDSTRHDRGGRCCERQLEEERREGRTDRFPLRIQKPI